MSVVQLATSARAVEPEVVRVAEAILARARAGEIDGLACAVSCPDDRSGRSYQAGMIGPPLLGMLTLLQARVTRSLLRARTAR